MAMYIEVQMKWIGLAGLVVLAACHVPATTRPSRPFMDPNLAAEFCHNPGFVSVLGGECVLRDQSPPVRLLPPARILK